MSNAIKLIEVSDIPQAAQSLAHAFMNDPLQRYVFPDAEERREKSPAHFEAILKYGVMFGEVYTTEDLEGAVVWLKPDETEVTPEKATESGLDTLPQVLGEEPANRFFSVLEYIDPFHKEDVPEPHWYVMVIGVDPAHHKKGLGKDLLMPVMDKARLSKTPIYLETAAPANIAFYQKLGFVIVREVTEPTSGLDLWTFKYTF